MGESLQVGDLVVPTGATNPNFLRRHGFGVIVEVVSNKGIICYEVKFTKSMMIRKFAYDAVRRHE